MATQANANPVAVIRQNLEVMAPELKAALPKHVTVEKFSRVAMTAIQQNPDLVAADRRSLFGAVVRLAQDGLLPDGREAALVIFNTKNRSGGWDKKVQAMPMIAGVLKKIRQSGDVAKVGAQVVCENDHFVWKLGFDEDVEHTPPALDKPRGRVIGAYATAVLKDGSRLIEVMSIEEIEKVRAVSKSKDKGPWVSWFEEMARKTVMRRLSKRLPMSTDLEDEVFSRDETLAHVEDKREFEVIEGGAAQPVSRLDALEHHIEDEGEFTEADDEVVDAETGEVEPEVSPTEEKLANIRNSIAAAKNDKGLAAIDGEWVKARAAYDDDVAAEIDGLIAERRKELAE
jgi:recombination protein RecT